MTLASPQFCDTCGAANRVQAQFCRVCGQSLHAPGSFSSPNSTITINNTTLTGLLSQHTTLKQRYVVLAQAGQGGFGAVYKASDTQFGNRLVAIKEMSQSNLPAQEVIAASEAFKNEAMLLAGLTHPNLPRIYEQFTDTGRSYLVMDFIEGETLEDLLNRQGGKKLSADRALDIALQLCSVLEYLHTRQPPIIFRDLKPGNVMLTPGGHVYLIDFGIARHFKPGQSKDTTALGSSGYAAPEQYGKSQTTARADIYSLGATLHQMLTGHDPSESPFHFAPLHLNQPALNGLELLVMSMISIDLNQRPASIAAVKQELQRIATQYMIGQTLPLPPMLPNTLSQPLASTSINPYQPQQPPKTPRKRATRQTSQSYFPPQVNTLYICLGHASRITSIAWSPDGKLIASASYDRTIHIWNAANGSNVLIYKGHKARVNALSWSPDSKLIASGSDDRTVQVWEGATGKLITTYSKHSALINTVAWSPDGKYIASAGEDRTVQIWNAKTQDLLLPPYKEHTDRVNVVAWSPDGRYIASAGKDTRVRIWEPQKIQQKRSLFSAILFPHQGQRVLNGHSAQIYALGWSPDSKRLASSSGDHHVRLWDVLTSSSLNLPIANASDIKNTLAWSPDGKRLALGGNDKNVQVWNMAKWAPANKNQPFIYGGHTGYVITIAWSPDGTRIASGGVDRSVQVWQAPKYN